MSDNKKEKRKRDGNQLRIKEFDAVQCRALELENEPEKMIVEGYAVRFNSPTVLFEMDGVEYKEQISSDAFTEARMDDVILNYDHQGKVMARTRNKTLTLEVREDGLYIVADLSGTAEGRTLYEEIKGGYIDRMSFKFTVKRESYDKTERMWTVERVGRLYDVAAVSIPAYDDTSIEARRSFVLDAEAQEERKRSAAADIRKRKLALKAKLLTMQK